MRQAQTDPLAGCRDAEGKLISDKLTQRMFELFRDEAATERSRANTNLARAIAALEFAAANEERWNAVVAYNLNRTATNEERLKSAESRRYATQEKLAAFGPITIQLPPNL